MSLSRIHNHWWLADSAEDFPEAAEIRSRQMAAFMAHAPINAVASLGISLMAGIALWQNPQHGRILAWVGVIWLIGLWHLYNWWCKRDLPRSNRISRRGPVKATIWSLVVGGLWGSSVMFYPESSGTHQILLTIMTAAMAAGASTSLGAIPAAAAAFICATLLPWVGYFLIQQDIDHLALASMSLIYMLAMLGSTRLIYSGFIDSVRVKQANAALLNQFHAERDEWFEISDTSEAFALFDELGTLRLWNENYRRLLSLPEESLYRGAARADILRCCVPSMAVKEGTQTLDQWVERQLRLHERPDPSIIEQLSDGRWLKSTARRTGRGQLVTLHADVTELKVHEQALTESEARLKAFFDHTPVEMALKDASGRYEFVSRRFEELYGVANKDVLGRTSADLFPPEVTAELQAHDAAVLESGRSSEREVTVPSKGGPRTFLAVKFPVFDSSGGQSGIGAVAIDITDRKTAEEGLRRQSLILDQMSDGLIVTDLDGELIDWNAAAENIFGYTKQDVLGKTPAILHPPAVAETLTAEIIAGMERDGRWAGEITCIRKDGNEVICETVVVPFYDEQGETVATIGVNRDITDRKRAEDELERSRTLLSDAVEALPDGFIILDSDKHLVLCNSRYREIFHQIADEIVPGLSMADLARETARHCVGLESAEATDAWVAERLDWHRGVCGSFELHLADGRWIRADDQRLPNGWTVGIRTDITELKDRQTALEESEKRFQDFAESSADWFWEMDADLKFTYFSPNVERVVQVPAEWHYGKTREEILGQDVDSELWAGHLRQLHAHQPFRDFVYSRVGEGVEPRWLSSSGVPRFAEDGAFLGYRGSGSDVTGEVEALKALEASEEQLRLVTDSLPVLIAYIDSDERFRFVNRTCAEWFGLPRGEIIGKSIVQIHQSLYESVRPYIGAALSGDRVSFEKPITYGDGTTRDVAARYVPRIDQEGGVEGFFVLAEDITERKMAELALREREARLHDLQRQLDHYSRLSAMGQLSSALAHELNQPLTAVMNYVQAGRRLMQANGGSGSAKIDEMFDKAVTQSARAGDVIRRLRGLFEKGETQPSPESINQVVEDVASLALMDAKALNIDYRLKFTPNLPIVNIDLIQIQQVVLNLVRNAVEALDGGEKRELWIETERAADGVVEVAVCDRGRGLSPEVREHLFDPFVTGKCRGMGVGLSISERIVKAHGGRLWAQPNPGGGTQFRFTLPVTAATDGDHGR